ncbi:hypothetical protein CDD83_1147 [Cordyceps sp. RAO-2017]|nr:hypothetical protein CDD83_1147 [Cordyceps sp. RAO-2017]
MSGMSSEKPALDLLRCHPPPDHENDVVWPGQEPRPSIRQWADDSLDQAFKLAAPARSRELTVDHDGHRLPHVVSPVTCWRHTSVDTRGVIGRRRPPARLYFRSLKISRQAKMPHFCVSPEPLLQRVRDTAKLRICSDLRCPQQWHPPSVELPSSALRPPSSLSHSPLLYLFPSESTCPHYQPGISGAREGKLGDIDHQMAEEGFTGQTTD